MQEALAGLDRFSDGGRFASFDRALAQAAASILGDEAMHWAVFRQVLGETPVVPAAFVS